MDQWLSVDQSYVAPHLRALAMERIVKKHEGRAPDPAIERASEAALASALAVVDRALRDTRHLAGEAFSLADVSLMPYVGSLPMLRAEQVMNALPHLAAWWTLVRERPSWRSVAS